MKIKNIYDPIFLQEKILFGMESSCIEIESIDEDIIEAVKLLTIGVSEDELYQKSIIDRASINELIRSLNEFGILEDELKEEQVTDKTYLERYKTNLNYLKNYSSLEVSALSLQKRLNDTKILLIGVGGASILASALVGMGIENIILVDYDNIELSNLNRQFIFSEENIGEPKVKAAKAFLSKLNNKSKIKTFNLKVKSYQDIIELVKSVDVVINAIDTPPIECTRWVNYCCTLYNKPFLQMGMGTKSIIVEKYMYTGGCYDCSLINQLGENFNETKKILNYVYSEHYKPINTSFAPNILAGAGILAMEIIKCILKINSGESKDYAIEIDLDTYEIKKINSHIKVPYCPTCGNESNGYASIEKLIELVKSENKY